MGGQGANQARIGTFRGLDWADSAVVGWVDVTHRETCPFPGQAAGAEGTDAPLVGELRQGVGLVHELAELAGAKELLNRCHQGLGINQLGRGQALRLPNRHAFFDDAL